MNFQHVTTFGSRGWDAYTGYRRMPGWARVLVGIAAVPGLILLLLSILLFVVSLLALFGLTLPLYRLLATPPTSGEPFQSEAVIQQQPNAARHVDARVID